MKVSISVAPKTAEEFREQLAAFKTAGFAAIDFGLYAFYPGMDIKEGKYNDFFARPIDELRAFFTPYKQAAIDCGIEIGLMHAVFPAFQPCGDAFNAYHRDVMKKNVELCGFFGCKYLVVHPFTVRDRLVGGGFEAEYAVNMELYQSLMPLAKQHDVILCLENMFHRDGQKCVNGSCSHALEAKTYIDELNKLAGEERFGFCFDCGHANLCGENVYDFVHILGNRIKALHLHDNQGFNDDHLQPYTGMMRWDYLLAALREIGYTGGLNFETFVYGSVHGKPLPEKVRPIMLKYVADIGHYFVEEIQG